jgi:hypothetical protein
MIKWEGEREGATTGVGEKRGGATRPDGKKLVSVAQSGSTVHGFQIRWHGDEAKIEATSMGRISRVEKALRGTRHGRQRRGAHRHPRLGP